MAYTFHSILNDLPQVGKTSTIYGYYINNTDYSLKVKKIKYVKVLFGNVNLVNYTEGVESYPSFIPRDNFPISLKCIAEIDGILYMDIIYTKAVYGNIVPDNFQSFIQKIPKGIFTHFEPEDSHTAWVKAKSGLVDDYYKYYFSVKKQVFSSEYSQELEFEYNGTGGLLSDSYDLKGLFHLFSSLPTYGLNAYDLELLITKYIFFRTSQECPVYVVNDASPLEPYWILGVEGYTQFDQTPPQTVLAPENYNPVLQNVQWVIYNASGLSNTFREELTKFIKNVSRSDIGNIVTFSNLQVLDDGFSFIGPTYKGDPRLVYGKCLQYIGQQPPGGQYIFPANILGYKKNST